MKRFLGLIIIFGIVTGVIVGLVKTIQRTGNKNDEVKESSGEAYVHELNIPIMEIDTLQPLFTRNRHVSSLLSLVYEPLVTIAKEENLAPMLATEWAMKDETHWIFKLRKGVKWHNDTDFTADDVIFTVNAILNDEIESIYRANLASVESIEKIDDYSVVFVLKEEDMFFPYRLLFPIIPEYYFKNGELHKEEKAHMFVGTGAYCYVAETEEYIELARNENWWKTEGEPKLHKIYWMKFPTYGEAIKAYKSAKVDLITTTMPDWEKKFGTIGNHVYRYESATFDVLIPNIKKLTLTSASVRKAILCGINRENIVSKVLNGNATVSDMPIHSRSNHYSSQWQTTFDGDKAKQILLNDGWQNNGKAWQKQVGGAWYRLKYTLLVNEENAEQLRVAEIIKENLAEINIEMVIKKVSYQGFQQAIQKGDFDFALASLDIKNELAMLDLLAKEGRFNFAKYADEAVEEAIENIRQEGNMANFQTVEKLWKEEMPYLGLYFRNEILLTNKSVKGGIEPFWNNPFAHMTTWCK